MACLVLGRHKQVRRHHGKMLPTKALGTAMQGAHLAKVYNTLSAACTLTTQPFAGLHTSGNMSDCVLWQPHVPSLP